MNKKKNYISLAFPTLILVTGITLQLLFWVNYINTSNSKDIERKLLKASNILPFLLPSQYHSKELGPESHSYADSIKLFTAMQKYADEMDVDYIYTMIEKNGNIYYTTFSGTEEELEDDEKAYYWYPLSDAEDSSFEVTKNFFKDPKTTYLTNQDKWGTYRSIYNPKYAPDGTLYLVGADVLINKINYTNLKNSLLIVLNFFIFLLLVLPLMLAFYSVRKKHEVVTHKVDKLRNFDALTNVYNRSSGLQILNNRISLFHQYKIPFSIFLVDIANLEETNKNQGIKRGDKLIQVLASMLKYTFRQSDKIIRLGEDDFAVVLSECNFEESKLFRDKLLEKISVFNTYNKNNSFLKINVAFSEYKGESLDEFMETSIDKLLFHKRRGDFFDVTLQEKIKEGITNNEFHVYFQPKVNADNHNVSFEALLRWHNEKIKIGPDQFIPVAEKNYLILFLTQLVIDRVMEVVDRYNYEVSINLSPVIFEKDTYFHNLYDRVKDFHKKELLIFEITEGVALKNLSETIKKIEAFNEIGIRFSLDDFGTGYSSLSYLNMLPVSEVKIDKSFVRKLKTNEETKVIIEMIVKLGKLLGFHIIAEGVEDLEDISILLSLNCYIFQGYYYDKAVPIEEAVQKIKNGFYRDLTSKFTGNS